MADLVITSSEVLQDTTNTQRFNGIAGETITPGQACYLDAADSNKVKLADADVSAITAKVKGIALNESDLDQPVSLQIAGAITIGAAATVIKGEIYVLSGNAGGIAPEGDLAVGDFVSILGVGNASDGIELILSNSGVQL